MTPLSISHLPPGSPWWMFAAIVAALALHIGAGSIAILSGWGAVGVPKGERWHRRFGSVFVIAMLVMGVMATTLAFRIGQPENIAAGIFSIYFVSTAWMTVRRKEGTAGQFEKVALLVVAAVSVLFLAWGIEAKMSPSGKLDGYQPVYYFVFAGLAAFFAVLDIKVIWQGGVSGVQRISRHLWRMCFAFFFASASFFLGQQKVMPKYMHGSLVLWALGLAPLILLVFWMIRVRLGDRFKRSSSQPAQA